MKNGLKKMLKWLMYIITFPVVYIVVSFILSWITVNEYNPDNTFSQYIYLNTNGVHLDVVIPMSFMSEELLRGLENGENSEYVSFGWGDEKFYLETPSWDDLTFKTAFTAMFMNSSTLMHVSTYENRYSDWIKIGVSEEQLSALQHHLNNSFQVSSFNEKTILEGKGYYYNDEFYQARGSYSLLNTCNSWVNSIFKQSGLKCCFCTPFDFGLMNKYD